VGLVRPPAPSWRRRVDVVSVYESLGDHRPRTYSGFTVAETKRLFEADSILRNAVFRALAGSWRKESSSDVNYRIDQAESNEAARSPSAV